MPFAGFPVFPLPPHHRGALRPSERGRHKPAAGLLPETRAPLRGFTEYPLSTRSRTRVSGYHERTRYPQLVVTNPLRRQPTDPDALLSFLSLQRLRSRGSACRERWCARRAPATAFHTLSPAFSPRDLPGFFHPGNALGIQPSGLSSPRGSDTSLEAPCFRAVFRRSNPACTPERPSRLRSLAPLGNPYFSKSCYTPAEAAALLVFFPLGLSLPPS